MLLLSLVPVPLSKVRMVRVIPPRKCALCLAVCRNFFTRLCERCLLWVSCALEWVGGTGADTGTGTGGSRRMDGGEKRWHIID